MFKIKITPRSNIFYLKKMKILLCVIVFMIKIFKLYNNFFILCYLIYKNNLYIIY